jgi:4,5-dihydroxyphthalate decarboxylase
MAQVKITLTCADYARLMPLATGEVKPEGIDLTLLLSRQGSWPERAEMLRRAVRPGGAGASGRWRSTSIARQGATATWACPSPLRNFTARDPTSGAAADPQPQGPGGQAYRHVRYSASGSIWYRHFLRFVGLDPAAIQWWIGDVDAAWSSPVDPNLPAGVKTAPTGRSLSDMLLADELDAVYSPPRPQAYHPRTGAIARLFPDFRLVEQDYFRQTGAFPPQHLIVLRREVWEANPWIARSLTEAFSAANDWFTAAQKSFPYATPG